MQKATANTRARGSSSGTSKSEHEIQTEILLEFGALPWMRIARQNTGKAFGYSTVKAALDHMLRGRFEVGLNLLKHAQLVTYGTPGQADIQGLIEYTYIGKGLRSMKLGRFLAIEVKKPGEKQDDDQVKWQAMIERHGGLYILAHSVADVWTVLNAEGFEDPSFEVVE
jgi:hypothetical protein